jgi:hypothetical protein
VSNPRKRRVTPRSVPSHGCVNTAGPTPNAPTELDDPTRWATSTSAQAWSRSFDAVTIPSWLDGSRAGWAAPLIRRAPILNTPEHSTELKRPMTYAKTWVSRSAARSPPTATAAAPDTGRRASRVMRQPPEQSRAGLEQVVKAVTTGDMGASISTSGTPDGSRPARFVRGRVAGPTSRITLRAQGTGPPIRWQARRTEVPSR